MDELMEAPESVRVDASDEKSTTRESRPNSRQFGSDAVPLRHSLGRDAALEGEERLRLVTAGAKRRSPRRRLGVLVVSGLVLVGVLVLVVGQFTSGGDGTARLTHRKGAELQGRPGESAVLPAAGQVDAGAEVPSQHAERHPHARRRHHRRDGRKHGNRERRQTDKAKASRPAAQPRPESAPPPEPEVTPAPETEPPPPPEPEVTPASEPEPEAAPPPAPEPEPTSSPESKMTEPSQVEAEFGFQK